MDDFRLINILPSPSQNVKQPDITHSSSTSLPPVILRPPPGSILSGFIINRDPVGNPVLRTENGDITFQTSLFLKIGTEVVIRVESRAGQAQAHILTINGEPPDATQKVSVFSPQTSQFGQQEAIIAGRPALQNPAFAPQGQAAPSSATSTPVANITVQSIVAGTVTNASPALPQGTQLELKVLTLTPPDQPHTTTHTAQQGAPSINAQLYAAYARGSNTLVPQGATTPAAPPAANVSPAAPTSPINPLQVGQAVTATVIGSDPAGETLVQTTQGSIIRLTTPTPPVLGSKITFEVTQLTPPAGQAAAGVKAEDASAPITTLARQWSTLQQIISLVSGNLPSINLSDSGLATLTGLNNPAAQAQGAVPSSALSTGLLVFITALRGGDFRGWLGRDTTRWLENNGHGNLIQKAEGEFLSLARQFAEPQPGQWQSLFFPVAAHGEVQQARLFVKRDKRKGSDPEDAKDGEDTRFIVEMDLSQLGEMQLDGFVHKDPHDMEFDLFIRSRAPLDEAIQQDIFTIYNDIGHLTGYKGHLLFQTVREFTVRPMEETLTQHISDVRV